MVRGRNHRDVKIVTIDLLSVAVLETSGASLGVSDLVAERSDAG